jgi:hypothetical protein
LDPELSYEISVKGDATYRFRDVSDLTGSFKGSIDGNYLSIYFANDASIKAETDADGLSIKFEGETWVLN